MLMYRQGDVLIVQRQSDADRQARPMGREQGRIVLAWGEATGHSHAVADKEATLLNDGSRDYLRVWGDSVDLVHEEHATITIPEGVYEVVRQREYTYEGDRSSRVVLD